jgi:hypothetical protein
MLSTLFSVAAALVLLPHVSAAQNSKPAEKLPPPCTVSGRVVTGAEGTPMKSSQVALIPERKTPESQVYATISDSSGRFTSKTFPRAATVSSPATRAT